jgi:Na+-driven multidrug efflux pump
MDGAGADPHRLRERGRGRQHDRHPHHPVRAAAVVWREQRRCHARRPELGAGKPGRAEAAAWRAGLHNTVCLGSIGAVFLLFAPQIIQLFTSDPDVAQYGVRCLRIVSAGFLFYGYAMVLTASFTPLAWLPAHPPGFGPTGVFIAVSVAFSTMAFVSGWLFSKGTWKTNRI